MQSQHVRQDQVLKPQCAASIWGRQYQEKAGWSTRNQQELQSRNCARNTVFESGRCGPCGRPVSTVPLSAWPSPHSQPQHQPPRHTGPGNRAVVLGGSGGKRECAGTGVFLPRRYGSSPDIRKKTCMCLSGFRCLVMDQFFSISLEFINCGLFVLLLQVVQQ